MENATIKRIEQNSMKKKHLRKKLYLQALKKISIFFRLYGISNPDINARLMFYSQLYFRKLDDITDGDEKLYSGNILFDEEKNRIFDYLCERELVLSTNYIGDYKDDMDAMMHEILELASKTGIDYREEFHTLFSSLRFDILRRSDISKGIIRAVSSSDLEKNFFIGYADSCAKCLTKVTESFDYDRTKLHNLLYANRIYYNLIDFLEDLSMGLLNIPEEDILKFGIKEKDIIRLSSRAELIGVCKNKGYISLREEISPEIYAWLDSELSKGIGYLNSWNDNTDINSLSRALKDLMVAHSNPTDTLLYLAYGVGTNSYLKNLVNSQYK